MSYPPPSGHPPPGGYPTPGGYPPPGGYGGYPTPGGYTGPPPSNGLATGALVTGLISALCLPVLALVAIPLGFAGLSRASKLNGVGRGQAIGGLVAGFIGLAWGVLFAVMVIAGIGFFATQVDDLTCSVNRTTLRSAAQSFQDIEGRDPVDEAELVREGYLRSEVETYDFTISDGVITVEAASGEGCD